MNHRKVSLEEVEHAFTKLQSYVYFDNYDLILRGRIAGYKRQLKSNLESFVSEFDNKIPFDRLITSRMKLSFLPKKLEPQQNKFPSNYYTNTASILGNRISQPNIYCDFPVQLHLIATIWLMRYGPFLEKFSPTTSYGNRLVVDRATGKIEGRSLFKPYFRQFQNWWSNAINATKTALKTQQSVTILNFDLKSFYHEVNFDFDKLEARLIIRFPNIKNDKIHQSLKRIHIEYRNLLKKVKPDVKLVKNIVPLPIGLFTSHIFANYHLRGLDRFIREECNPLYYGRYVDDVLIVIENTVLEEADIKAKTISNVDNNEIIRLYLKNYFPKLFAVPEDSAAITFKIASVKDLKLNMDKLFIYQFDFEHTPNLIEKFVEEQKERGSMFRFLSDEEDETFDDFESQTFESNFDHIDLNKARFKNLEDNKYKLSTFLSKLIKRRIQRGEGYKEDEIEKVLKYFKGSYLIKHYYFWEKLFTLLVVYKRKRAFSGLFNEILQAIKGLEISGQPNPFIVTENDYQNSLQLHLQYSLGMSLGLAPSMTPGTKQFADYLVSQYPAVKSLHIANDKAKLIYLNRLLVFRMTGLLRGAFVYYPMLQFTNFALIKRSDLTSSESIFELLGLPNDIEPLFTFNKINFIPFRIKFWQAAIFLYYKNLFLSGKQKGSIWRTDRFSSNEILTDAFDLFYTINNPNVPKAVLINQYFKAFKTDEHNDRSKLIIPKERARNFYIHEVFVQNGGASKDTYRIAVINKYVDSIDFLASLDGNPIHDPVKMEAFDRILDEVSQIKNCDLFVMPELSLPHRLMGKFTDQAARKQIAFVGGIEHLNVRNIGFNFIMTALPLNIEGDKDAIPVLRLKNHYAPIEEQCIWDEKERGSKMVVPKPYPYRYDLFEWRGLYFASYYCYELADVFHRSIFFSKVDAIIAPVWNVDTHYYNSIIDAATRDMHNYFIIVNTSQYGFSKISRPQDHVNKEKMIVKGGTEKGYDFTVLVGDIKVKELRDFQKLSHLEQKELKTKDKSIKLKATPPDFPVENVEMRENNGSYYM